MVLGLQELKLVFDPITGLCNGELEARLTRLVRCLRTVGEASTQLESTFETARLGGVNSTSSGGHSRGATRVSQKHRVQSELQSRSSLPINTISPLFQRSSGEYHK